MWAQGQSAFVYSQDFYKLVKGRDLLIALTQGLVFGLIISMVGCWRGYRTRGGAEGVGNAPTSSVTTYVLNLCGFERITLKPGEIKTVCFKLPAADLQIINRGGRRVVEPGEFAVHVGTPSENLLLDGTFNVSGASQ